MSTRTRPPRTLSDIRTHSGRANRGHQSYKDYFQAGALELEKWRREKEKEASLKRLAIINDRIAQINHEKSVLLGAAMSEDLRMSESNSTPTYKSPRGTRIKY